MLVRGGGVNSTISSQNSTKLNFDSFTKETNVKYILTTLE
jgi:hypothetical protein